MSQIIDISPLISPSIAVWPGDVPFRRRATLRIADGDNIDLSAIESSVHLGAHTDAPSHYTKNGAGIADRSLSLYYGPCQVVAVDVAPGARVYPADLPGPIIAPRVLLHTGSFPNPDRFSEDFCSASPELIALLAGQGVVLIGIDTPSIDPFSSAALESHQAVAAADMAVLEGIVLTDVAAGLYTLIALPLKIAGADASPVRAVLLS